MHSSGAIQQRIGAVWLWLREVAALVLAISLILFGAILLDTTLYAIQTGDLRPFGKMVVIETIVACLRFLIAPAVVE